MMYQIKFIHKGDLKLTVLTGQYYSDWTVMMKHNTLNLTTS